MDANAIAAAVVEQVVGLIDKRITPIMDRLNALESVEQVKAQDVSAEVVRSILDGDNLEHIVGLKVAEHLAENPPPAGEKGMDGKDGADGKDGVGLAGALIDRDGSLVVTLTNGEVKSLGSVVGKDGANGADGRDGFSLEHFSAERSDDGTITLKFADEHVSKTYQFNIPVVQYRGYWREGRKCAEGNAITHNGSLWIAKRDTCAEPSAKASNDWYLAVMKGRDGRDGYDGKNFGERPTINLRGE